MNGIEVIVDGFGRIQDTVRDAVSGLSAAQLNERLDGTANSIGWLVWHLTRVQDDHVADAAGTEQVWTADGWSGRFDLPFGEAETGYGQSAEDVEAVQVKSANVLTGYHDAVCGRTKKYVSGLNGSDLDRVVDDAWDPPVTLGVRLVSVISDDLQHVGQAAYLRGLVSRQG
jgi:uncharacterized damage-inducible protein DinB